MKLIESLGYHKEVYSPLMQQLLQNDASLKPFHNGLVSTPVATRAASAAVECPVSLALSAN